MEHVVIAVTAADVEASDEGALYPSLDEAARQGLIAALDVLADEVRSGRGVTQVAVALKKPDGELVKRLRIVVAAEADCRGERSAFQL